MRAARYLLTLALSLSTTLRVAAQPVPVPSDVAVTLTAEPSANLAPGESITFTLTVTNLGPMPVQRLQIISSNIYDDQIDVASAWTDCQVMYLAIVDEIDSSFFYYYSWYPTDASVLAVGETSTCHVRFALRARAPQVLPFSFGLPSYYVDINPNNDIGTVVLQRAVQLIPTLSPAMLLLLAGLLGATAGVAYRCRWRS